MTFQPGQATTQQITVQVVGDTKNEPSEYYIVNLSNPSSNATISRSQGTVTILNDDNQLSIGDVSVREGDSGTTTATFPVSLSPASNWPVTVHWATGDGTATVSDNDYKAANGDITFNPGDTTKLITVQVVGDTKVEPDETFLVSLTGSSNAIISKGIGTGTIRNDDFLVANTLDSGPGSMRQAILDANRLPGLDRITFRIGTGVQIISPTSPLPTITDPVVIDGTSQPGFAGSPIIEINGANAGVAASGLTIGAGCGTVRGLVIDRFSGDGIILEGGSHDVIQGNFIGTDVSGSFDLGNKGYGVLILDAASANTVGGSVAAARNVISGNDAGNVAIQGDYSTANLVQGNYIGTDRSGTYALGTEQFGLGVRVDAPGNMIGGSGAGQGNLISGNFYGIVIGGGVPNTVVQGNRIGTNAAGTAAVGNHFGVQVYGRDTLISGIVPGAGNLISGNLDTGILITSVNAFHNQVQGNFIGTDVSGSFDLGNKGYGVLILDAASANTVGGSVAAARNVISGNDAGNVAIQGDYSTANLVQGNYIGTDRSGTYALGTEQFGLGVRVNSPGNMIGGSGAGQGNLISGNFYGIVIGGGVPNTVVQGNRIGTNAAGTAAVGNHFGVQVYGATR